MDLHGVVRGIVNIVNPDVTVTLRRNVGYVTDAAGARLPTYDNDEEIVVQAQPLAGDELRYVDGLGIQGERRAIYAAARLKSMVRETGAGGDLVVFNDGTIWKVVATLEEWPGWTKAVVVRQDGE